MDLPVEPCLLHLNDRSLDNVDRCLNKNLHDSFDLKILINKKEYFKT